MDIRIDFTKNVRYELMYGYQAKAELDKYGVAYLPLGCLEMHGSHLPMGLDVIKAHEMCCLMARHIGGVVFPPHYYSGIHKNEKDVEEALVAKWGNLYNEETAMGSVSETVRQIGRMNVRLCVLYTGHYPPAQLEMVRNVAKEINESENNFRVLNCVEADFCGGGDHAGVVETSLLLYLRRDLVNMAAIYEQGYKNHYWNGENDPKLASSAKGERYAQKILRYMEREIGNIINKTKKGGG